jgi:demethylmenaquinone methyltransferase/2-methoxy-6-polyprenyl-1,4-benzoquinol methylase
MNDLMSLGTHRWWKDFALARSSVRSGQRVLDVAAGSGDMSARFSRQVGESGRVVMTDINPAMLERGRERLIDKGIGANVDMLLADAEALPFAPHQFDCVSIAFGLRNVTRIPKALASMARMLRPGGRVMILEFSHPVSGLLSRAYDIFSFRVIPPLGRIVTGDEASYRYLVESIRRHPGQDQLSEMMRESGLEDVSYHNLNGGIVALHIGFRY